MHTSALISIFIVVCLLPPSLPALAMALAMALAFFVVAAAAAALLLLPLFAQWQRL